MFIEENLVDGEWRIERGFALVLLAEASYAVGRDLRYVVEEDLGLNLIAQMPLGANQGFVAEGEHAVILSYSGTNELSDWLANLKILKVDRDWGSVHRGFLNAFLVEEEKALTAAEVARSTNKPLWVTGHSLGGALAQVAAYELLETGVDIGLCTFGQPRTVAVAAGGELEKRLPFGYHRFVNENDIVTRIPPTIPHSGDLIQLGRRKRWFGLEGIEAEAAEEAALDQEEFEALQKRLQAIRSDVVGPSRGDPATERAIDRSVEGIIPGIRNHKITAYRTAIEGLLPRGGEAEVFSDMLQYSNRARSARTTDGVAGDVFENLFPDAPDGTRGPNRALRGANENINTVQDEETLIPALIRLSLLDWEPPQTIKVLSRIGDLMTICASTKDLEALENDRGVRSIEISRAGGLPELTTSIPFVKARPVDRGVATNERGTDALVGIIDTGVDVMHDAFAGADGHTRIVAIWDQMDNAGPSPKAIDPAFPFDFGTLYVRSDIEDIRAGRKQASQWLRDPEEHGTHVAGIAAGAATGDMPDGMAPDAQIVVVIPDMETISGNPASLGYSVSHVNALEFLKTIAAGNNSVIPNPMPIAINVSLGMNAGAHDGQTLLEAAFDGTSGQGRDPGIVVVKSAGNERPHHGHAKVEVAKGRVDVDWTSNALDRSQDYFEAWYDKLDVLEFVLHTPNGGTSPVISRRDSTFSGLIDGNRVLMRLRCVHPDNGDNVLYLAIQPDARSILAGVWRLEVRGFQVGARTRGLNIWVERDNSRAVQFGAPSQQTTLSIPGTANHIVTVGATDTQEAFPGVIRASSFGPTRDDRPKPEICAPGLDILSAHANQANPKATVAMTGTSMAAPHVTGAMALAMSMRVQAGKQQLNQEQLTSLLIQTAQFQSTLHHRGFGFGILDVSAFLKLCDQQP